MNDYSASESEETKELPMNEYTAAALRLHRYMMNNHWHNGGLVGPDPGIRFNYRLFRFVKSYAPAFDWNDSMYYIQAQGYWILVNWKLFDITGDEAYRTIARICSETLREHQRPDGAWEYPNPEWKGRIVTSEGTWGAIGLLETYRQTHDQATLDSILHWWSFLQTEIGFQQQGNELAVNYGVTDRKARVPNNTAFVLRFLTELAEVTGLENDAERRSQLLNFLRSAQTPDGEIPYAVEGEAGSIPRDHFQCIQYNAFEVLDLMRYYELTGDAAALTVIQPMLHFLEQGIGHDGHAFYQCGESHHTVTYHTAVLAAAFTKANALGIGNYMSLPNRAYHYVLDQQRADGSFPHSKGDYGILSDHRSYPRYLAMIALHLLQADPIANRKEDAQSVLRTT